MFAAIALLAELPYKDETYEWHFKPSNAPLVVTRFICGIVMHIYLQTELCQGFSNMKYALNHPWKFERSKLAFFAGYA